MKGLLVKDFYCLKQNMKYIITILLLFGLIFIPQGGSNFSSVLILLFSMMVITTMNYDHTDKWNHFALTMPLTRTMLVRGKYFFLLLMLAAGLIVSLLFSLVGATVFQVRVSVLELLAVNGCSALAALWMGAILLPLIYRFGVERARLLLLLIVAVPLGGILAIGPSLHGISMPYLTPQWIALLAAGIVLLTALAFFCSYLLSVKIYQKRELA